MTDSHKRTDTDSQNTKKYLYGIFFLFGFSTMGWVPRFPEVKAHMALTNGQFGSIISVGALGGIVLLLVGGHIVHRFGTTIVMAASSLSFLIGLGLIVHVTSVPIFLFLNVLIGAAVAGFHISINAQVLHEQELTGEVLVPRTAGAWSSGALVSILLAGYLTTRVSLVLHIGLASLIAGLGIIYLILKIRPHELAGTTAKDNSYSLRTVFKSFEVNWMVSIGMLLGVQLEFSAGDWATIYSKENLGFSAGVATIPYIIFMCAMILGRLTFHRFLEKYRVDSLIKAGGLIGGASFITGILLSDRLSVNHPTLSFVFVSLAFAISGFCSSFMGPMFMNIANQQSKSPGGVVVGQLGVINNGLTYLVKAVIAWTAQWLSLPIALIIPGAMLMAVMFVRKTAVKDVH
jgi:MFS family permease